MFKTLLTVLIFALSTSSFAESRYVSNLRKLSWAELKENYDVDFEGDQIMFGGHFLSILDTCMADATTIRTLEEIRIEEQDGDTFVFVGYEYLYRKINTTRTMVDGDGTIEVPYTIATRRLISVVENDSDFNGRLLFKKEFVVPNCQ